MDITKNKKVINLPKLEGRTENVKPKKTNHIKPYVLFNYGTTIATILATAYASESAKDKLHSCNEILNCELQDNAKIKFIGDIMIRPKKERLAISRKLFKLLEENEQKEVES